MAIALESHLITRALEGDRAALREIVARALPHIERQLLRYPLTEDDRADVAQTTLLQMLRKLGSFRGDSSFSTWLFRVTANEALMLMRSQRRWRSHFVDAPDFATFADREGEPDDQPAALLEREQARLRVSQALEALPEDYRSVVVAHYRDELALQHIASELCISESAVRSRLHRARARLRTLLAA